MNLILVLLKPFVTFKVAMILRTSKIRVWKGSSFAENEILGIFKLD